MRSPAKIKSWLSIEQMFQWLQEAPDQSAHKRRMAIWLTHTGNLNAQKIAEILDISTQTVWLWIRQYNSLGPDGLKRPGRGGRRWGFLSVQQEAELLEPFLQRTRQGRPPKAAEIKPIIEKALGKKVSMPYIYHLLNRHGMSHIIAQTRLKDPPAEEPDNFRKISRPWTRNS